MAAAAQMDPACYFCRKRKHASSACPTVDEAPLQKRTRRYRSFEAARTYAQGLGLTSKAEWKRWCTTVGSATSGHLARDVPASPHKVYKGKWVSWGDWLGTGNVAVKDKQFRSFADARAFARSLHLSSKAVWRRWCNEGERPADIPTHPEREYAGQGWTGYVDWLGNELAEGEECAICLNALTRTGRGRNTLTKLRGCGHRFHRGCIDEWHAQGNAKTCPHCRGPLD